MTDKPRIWSKKNLLSPGPARIKPTFYYWTNIYGSCDVVVVVEVGFVRCRSPTFGDSLIDDFF